MSINFPQHEPTESPLTSLLTPMEFKTVLLVACGLSNHEIGDLLGTKEPVIANVLRDVYRRMGCSNSRDLVLRYIHELESGLRELGRLRRELAELETRAGQILHIRPGSLLRHIN
jgi:DNA-binding CsgD family transcriptional regulator